MPLIPDNDQHLAQILAGTAGRDRGHEFEKTLTADLNRIDWTKERFTAPAASNLYLGHPANSLMKSVVHRLGIRKITAVKAYWLGGLATSGLGDRVLDDNGNPIKRSKSDVLIEIEHDGIKSTVGVSVKTCNNATPTNAQLYFTTASAFCTLLRTNGIDVSAEAERALRMFCGDVGFRPCDDAKCPKTRKSDPDRWFWEELPATERAELEDLFTTKQREITLVLLKFAYPADPYPPRFLMHQMRGYKDINKSELAIYEIDDLVQQSMDYKGFELRPYLIRKGRFKGDTATHLAPRFGIVQFQRGGQKQHPTQLQFNLAAGYFMKLEAERQGEDGLC